MKKIILLGFLYLPICIFAQKNYFSITGRTFLEEYIVPNQTTKSPLSAVLIFKLKECRNVVGWQIQKGTSK